MNEKLTRLEDLLSMSYLRIMTARLALTAGETTDAKVAEIIRDIAGSVEKLSRAGLTGGDQCPSPSDGQNFETSAGEPQWEGGEYE